jgi:hypothetical protein
MLPLDVIQSVLLHDTYIALLMRNLCSVLAVYIKCY